MIKHLLSSLAVLAMAVLLSGSQQPKPDLPKKPSPLTDEEKGILENREILENLDLLQDFDKILYFEYFADQKKPEPKKNANAGKPETRENERKAK